MATVTLLLDDDRARLARSLAAVWSRGGAAWVLDAAATPQRLAAVTVGLVPHRTLAQVRATGHAEVEVAAPEDVVTVVTTSGSTGPPKALALSRTNLDASADGASALLEVGPGDRWLLALPLHHVAGQSVLWRAARLGHPPIVQERLDPPAANHAGATIGSLVPTQLHRVVRDGHHLDARVLLGGAAIAQGLLKAAADRVGGIHRSYGLTETAGGCVYDGVAFPGVEVVARNGLLGVRGSVVATARLTPDGPLPVVDPDGWLWTRDLGDVARDGTVSVWGRADDVIITGGIKVHPVSVEAALEDHPAVARAGVVGVPDHEWGQLVTAVVVLGDQREAARELDSRTREELADAVADACGRAAVPRRWIVTTSLPQTSLGKVARATLRSSILTA